MTPKLYVCSLSRLPETVEKTQARHLVTLLGPTMNVETPVGIPSHRHLKLIANDIATPLEGHILPGTDHVEQLIGFVESWDRAQPMLIHCWAGISRSTAAAYIAASVLNPNLDEVGLAQRLRTASPSATPNPRLIELADTLLGRDGRMIHAIAEIGRGADAYEGIPFELDYGSPT
jgi:predicted protein tyrosine phosphatase